MFGPSDLQCAQEAMGSYISLENDCRIPINCYWCLRGGGPPWHGYSEKMLAPGQKMHKKFTLSLVMEDVCYFDEDKQEPCTYKDISPPFKGETRHRMVSNVLAKCGYRYNCTKASNVRYHWVLLMSSDEDMQRTFTVGFTRGVSTSMSYSAGLTVRTGFANAASIEESHTLSKSISTSTTQTWSHGESMTVMLHASDKNGQPQYLYQLAYEATIGGRHVETRTTTFCQTGSQHPPTTLTCPGDIPSMELDSSRNDSTVLGTVSLVTIMVVFIGLATKFFKVNRKRQDDDYFPVGGDDSEH